MEWLAGSGFSFRNGSFQRNWGGYGETDGGIAITEATALRTIALYRGVNLIAGANASLPLDVFKKRPGGRREKVEAHPVERLLDSTPNPEMSSMDLRHFGWVSKLLWGNSYCKVVWRERARKTPIALWPMYPDAVSVERTGDDPFGDVYYTHTVNGQKEELDARDVWHSRLMSLDGINGLSLIGMARNGVGLNQLMAKYAANHFKGGGGQRLGISVEGRVNDELRDNLQKDWEKNYGGIANSGRPVIAGSNAKFSNIGVPFSDMQFIELMQFSDEQMAMLLGVPPHMLGIVSKTTSWGTGIGEQKQGFMTFTLAPLLTFEEKSIERCLITGDEGLYVKHNTGAYLRADIKSRMQALSVMRREGAINANEWRALEDMDPYDGGDEYMVQAQMIPVHMAGKIKPPKPANAPKEA